MWPLSIIVWKGKDNVKSLEMKEDPGGDWSSLLTQRDPQWGYRLDTNKLYIEHTETLVNYLDWLDWKIQGLWLVYLLYWLDAETRSFIGSPSEVGGWYWNSIFYWCNYESWLKILFLRVVSQFVRKIAVIIFWSSICQNLFDLFFSPGGLVSQN